MILDFYQLISQTFVNSQVKVHVDKVHYQKQIHLLHDPHPSPSVIPLFHRDEDYTVHQATQSLATLTLIMSKYLTLWYIIF